MHATRISNHYHRRTAHITISLHPPTNTTATAYRAGCVANDLQASLAACMHQSSRCMAHMPAVSCVQAAQNKVSQRNRRLRPTRRSPTRRPHPRTSIATRFRVAAKGKGGKAGESSDSGDQHWISDHPIPSQRIPSLRHPGLP